MSALKNVNMSYLKLATCNKIALQDDREHHVMGIKEKKRNIPSFSLIPITSCFQTSLKIAGSLLAVYEDGWMLIDL